MTILTNNHVIDGATNIKKVQLSDKRQFQASWLAPIQVQNVAVLKINASGCPRFRLATRPLYMWAILYLRLAIHSALAKRATMEIVSATGRGGLGIENYEDFIPTDASINPGNSGGAMIDPHGYWWHQHRDSDGRRRRQSGRRLRNFDQPGKECDGPRS